MSEIHSRIKKRFFCFPYELCNGRKVSIVELRMLEDKDTNLVYIADTLPERRADIYNRLTKLLSDFGIDVRFLNRTKDIWCRDYMPVQVDKSLFVKYHYAPDYMWKSPKYMNDITDSTEICNELGVKCKETDLIIDGGNVVLCGDKVVMTDKVFTENRYEKGDKLLLDKLSELFEHEVITIPWGSPGTCDPDSDKDVFGHADGFIKYAGGNHILMSNVRETAPTQTDTIRKKLESNGYSVTELTYDVALPNVDYNWAYINFLQVGSHIILPTFGIDEDSQAASQAHHVFPSCTLHTFRCRNLANWGGALHCITWNVYMD